MFDKKLDEMIVNMVNQIDWFRQIKEMVKRLREVHIFVDIEYYNCDVNGIKNSLQKLVMMG